MAPAGILTVPLGKPRYGQAREIHPGNGRVLHHARILVDETDASHWRDLDDPGPGFGGMDAPEAHFPDGHFLGWAPGKLPAFTKFVRVPVGHPVIVFQFGLM